MHLKMSCYDFNDKRNDKIFDLYVDDGKIFKIEEKSK